MKNIRLLLLAFIFSTLAVGQSTLATIDRLNGPGPTAAATFPSLTAVGITRAGVTQFGTTGSGSFKSRSWETGPSLNPTKYIQWSLESDSSFDFTLTELDIRYRRSNNNAPTNIQIFYSFDGFDPTGPNPSGFAAGGVQTYTAGDTNSKILMLPLSNLNFDDSGTITFRLFGWAAGGNDGQLNIQGNAAWRGSLSILNPGIRILGSASNILVYSNGVWTPNAPSGFTGFDNAYVINGNYTLNSNISLNTLTVSPEGNVIIPNGVNVNCNSISLQSNSTRYSSLIRNGTITGTVRYNLHVNGQSGIGIGAGANALISPPLSGQTFEAFAAANSNITTDPNDATRKLFGPFNKTTGTYQIYSTVNNASAFLNAGNGYRAASNDNGGFTFTGTAVNGVVTYNIENSGPQFAEWNLIGNPYPSYLNVREFLEHDVDPSAAVVRNIDLMSVTNAAIYGYDGDATGIGGDGWVIYNLSTPTTVKLTPGQGFLVTANAANVGPYNMEFTNSMRKTGNTDDFITGRMADTNEAHLKLQATIDGANYHTDIYFNDNSTSGLDLGYDAGVFGNIAAAKAIYSHSVQDNNGIDLGIQSLDYADLGSDIIIPLGVNVPEGQEVILSIAESDLPANLEVYLEDNVAKKITLLTNSEYIFTTNTTLNETGRFFLRFNGQALNTSEETINGLQIYTSATPKALFIKGLLSSPTQIALYDLQGRIVLSTTLEGGSNSNEVNIDGLSAGVYIVKLSNSSQQKTQKVIIK